VSRYTTHVFDDDNRNWLSNTDTAVFRTIAKPVPASALSRVWNVAVLSSGLVSGAFSEGYKNSFSGSFSDWMVSDRNVDKLAESLLKMRGAALKLGQFLSLADQDNLPKNLIKAMERARAEAYKMPDLQLEAAMR
jgi:aarF domain-containing kinase